MCQKEVTWNVSKKVWLVTLLRTADAHSSRQQRKMIAKAAPVYRPRRPRQSPLYRIIEQLFPQFEQLYPERYEKRYGFWRPIIGDVVRRFLRCGDLHFGFARVRRGGSECGHEMFVPFSCRQRCLCPSCHQKRALLLADRMVHQICLPAPHRQYVWTIPKRLRDLLPPRSKSRSTAPKPAATAPRRACPRRRT